ncbi:MAG: HAMP domain-containing protein [Bacteroidia bacterium]|nr:HAMP domain-containing protein [Bacteroidia bacterium]
MKIKTKLTLGVGLLFLLIILLTVVGAWYIHALKTDTENILEANYNSLEYSRFMLSSLELKDPKAISDFDAQLKKQELNITEIGEKEATMEVRAGFNAYRQNPSDTAVKWQIRNNIFKIMDVNMQAIQRKSEIAKSTAGSATLWIAISGTFCFLIAFVLLFNLPENIANPIKELTLSIKQIADKNYTERVHFEDHNEFGDLAASFNSMAKKLQEYNTSNLAKLMMEKKRIETLINNMKDPVIGLDENLKVLFANEKAMKITGLNPADFIGHFAKDLALKNDLIRLLIQDILNLNGAQESKPKALKIFADNKEGYFEKEILHINIVPTGETESKLIGHVIVLRNVTEYKELDFAKTNFIATISHEFKTPISSIKLSLQLLNKHDIGHLNDEQKHLLTSINDDADRLLKITGELLNMAQVDSGNIQLAIGPSDPMEIVSYAIEANKMAAEQKKIKINVQRPEHLPKVLADTEKSAWVLTNLISNAIRYSYENSVIHIKIATEDSNVIFSVADSGQGIAPEYKDKVFTRYFKVPGTKKEGTGLGLAISKEFIEAQGGQIKVESEYGAGSTFSIVLKSA